MEVKRLPDDIKAHLRSGIRVVDVPQCINELVLNSLDAKSTLIAVRVNLQSFRLQVVDNGSGIKRENLNKIGELYMTTKCSSLQNYKKTSKFYGFKGEFLASLKINCKQLLITTRIENDETTYIKTFKNDATKVNVTKKRPSIGTTVTIEEFLHNLPVRQKRVNIDFDLEAITRCLEHLSVIHPKVSFTLRNDINKKIIFENSRFETVEQAFTNLCPEIKSENLGQIKISKGAITVNGLISKKTITSSKYQLIYLNKRPVAFPEIQKLISQQFSQTTLVNESIKKENNFGYVCNICCPYSYVQVIYASGKDTIEFKQPDMIFKYVEKLFTQFFFTEKLFKPSNDNEEKSRKHRGPRSKVHLSDIEGVFKGIGVKRKFEKGKVEIESPKKHTAGLEFYDFNKHNVKSLPKKKTKIEKNTRLTCKLDNTIEKFVNKDPTIVSEKINTPPHSDKDTSKIVDNQVIDSPILKENKIKLDDVNNEMVGKSFIMNRFLKSYENSSDQSLVTSEEIESKTAISVAVTIKNRKVIKRVKKKRKTDSFNLNRRKRDERVEKNEFTINMFSKCVETTGGDNNFDPNFYQKTSGFEDYANKCIQTTFACNKSNDNIVGQPGFAEEFHFCKNIQDGILFKAKEREIFHKASEDFRLKRVFNAEDINVKSKSAENPIMCTFNSHKRNKENQEDNNIVFKFGDNNRKEFDVNFKDDFVSFKKLNLDIPQRCRDDFYYKLRKVDSKEDVKIKNNLMSLHIPDMCNFTHKILENTTDYSEKDNGLFSCKKADLTFNHNIEINNYLKDNELNYFFGENFNRNKRTKENIPYPNPLNQGNKKLNNFTEDLALKTDTKVINKKNLYKDCDALQVFNPCNNFIEKQKCMDNHNQYFFDNIGDKQNSWYPMTRTEENYLLNKNVQPIHKLKNEEDVLFDYDNVWLKTLCKNHLDPIRKPSNHNQHLFDNIGKKQDCLSPMTINKANYLLKENLQTTHELRNKENILFMNDECFTKNYLDPIKKSTIKKHKSAEFFAYPKYSNNENFNDFKEVFNENHISLKQNYEYGLDLMDKNKFSRKNLQEKKGFYKNFTPPTGHESKKNSILKRHKSDDFFDYNFKSFKEKQLCKKSFFPLQVQQICELGCCNDQKKFNEKQEFIEPKNDHDIKKEKHIVNTFLDSRKQFFLENMEPKNKIGTFVTKNQSNLPQQLKKYKSKYAYKKEYLLNKNYWNFQLQEDPFLKSKLLQKRKPKLFSDTHVLHKTNLNNGNLFSKQVKNGFDIGIKKPENFMITPIRRKNQAKSIGVENLNESFQFLKKTYENKNLFPPKYCLNKSCKRYNNVNVQNKQYLSKKHKFKPTGCLKKSKLGDDTNKKVHSRKKINIKETRTKYKNYKPKLAINKRKLHANYLLTKKNNNIKPRYYINKFFKKIRMDQFRIRRKHCNILDSSSKGIDADEYNDNSSSESNKEVGFSTNKKKDNKNKRTNSKSSNKNSLDTSGNKKEATDDETVTNNKKNPVVHIISNLVIKNAEKKKNNDEHIYKVDNSTSEEFGAKNKFEVSVLVHHELNDNVDTISCKQSNKLIEVKECKAKVGEIHDVFSKTKNDDKDSINFDFTKISEVNITEVNEVQKVFEHFSQLSITKNMEDTLGNQENERFLGEINSNNFQIVKKKSITNVITLSNESSLNPCNQSKLNLSKITESEENKEFTSNKSFSDVNKNSDRYPSNKELHIYQLENTNLIGTQSQEGAFGKLQYDEQFKLTKPFEEQSQSIHTIHTSKEILGLKLVEDKSKSLYFKVPQEQSKEDNLTTKNNGKKVQSLKPELPYQSQSFNENRICKSNYDKEVNNQAGLNTSLDCSLNISEILTNISLEVAKITENSNETSKDIFGNSASKKCQESIEMFQKSFNKDEPWQVFEENLGKQTESPKNISDNNDLEFQARNDNQGMEKFVISDIISCDLFSLSYDTKDDNIFSGKNESVKSKTHISSNKNNNTSPIIAKNDLTVLDVISSDLLISIESNKQDYLKKKNHEDSKEFSEKNEWVKNTENNGTSFYVNTRTGMTMMQSPDNQKDFQLKERIESIPKGFSPIIKQSPCLDTSLSSSGKNKLYEELIKSHECELDYIKWKRIMKNQSAKKFFKLLYKDRVENMSCSNIPDISKYKVSRRIVKSYNMLKALVFTKDLFDNLKVIGQLDKKFIVTMAKNNSLLILFDQHAVHERIRVENLYKEYSSTTEEGIYKFKSCKLENNIILKLNNSEENILCNNKKSFETLGIFFSIKNNLINITEIPFCVLKKGAKEGKEKLVDLVKSIFEEVIDHIKSSKGPLMTPPKIIQNVMNSEACRGAIMFGDKLEISTCAEHIKKLSQCNAPFQCAHGRPTLAPIIELLPNVNEVKYPNLKKLLKCN